MQTKHTWLGFVDIAHNYLIKLSVILSEHAKAKSFPLFLPNVRISNDCRPSDPDKIGFG